jgi:hypothetical protein
MPVQVRPPQPHRNIPEKSELLKNEILSQTQWLTPAIPAMQKV